jgi:hypothetical protein
MASVPLVTLRKWRRIARILPANRQDRHVISAILFRQCDGASLRDTSRWFAISRAKINEWERELSQSGALQQVMDAVGVRRAGVLVWRRGGPAPVWRRRTADRGRATVVAKLDRFREQLREG